MPYIPPFVRRVLDPVKPADAIVYRDGEYAVAVDRDGRTIARSTDHAEVINEAINFARYNGYITLVGDFSISHTIIVKKQLSIDIYGNLEATNDMPSVIQLGDTDKLYYRIFVRLKGVIDGKKLTESGIKMATLVDSVIEGGTIVNTIYSGITMEGLNSHISVRDFTIGYCGAGVHVGRNAEFIHLENISSYVNENVGFNIVHAGPVTCINCISNGDASVDKGTSVYVNNAFNIVGARKQILLIGPKVWTSSNKHLKRAMYIEFENNTDTIIVRIEGLEVRPDGGLPASFSEIMRVVTYADTHYLIARVDVENAGGKPIINFVNNGGYAKVEGALHNVGAPVGYTGRVKIRSRMGYVTVNGGIASFTGDGTTTQFTISHGLSAEPRVVIVTPKGSTPKPDSIDWDATSIYISYSTAPASGTTLTFSWYAEV